MRKILIVLGALVAVILAIAAYFVWNLDAVVKSRIERSGSLVAGVPVTVGAVDISLAGGSARITDLSIANPPGFGSEPAIRFGEISARIDVVSQVIRQVTTTAPVIRVEGPPERTNIDVLRDNVAPRRSASRTEPAVGDDGQETQDTESIPADTTDRQATEDDGDEPGGTYTIDLIEIEQASVIVDLEGLDSPVRLDIDRLAFVGLHGTRSVITTQVMRQLTDRILDEVRDHLAEVGREALRMEVERRVDELEEKARERLKNLFD